MDRKESRKTKWLTVLMLLAIVASGAVFRFHKLHTVEPFLADEAIYVLEARYLYSIVESAWHSMRLKAEEQKTGEDLWNREKEAERFTEHIEGKPPWFARPGHLYLVCLAMMIFGPDSLIVGPVVSAFFGTLCIPLIFLLGRKFYGNTAGLLGAAFFSLSGVQVIYSRSGLTEQDSLFFFLLALLFYVNDRAAQPERKWWSLILSGFFIGVSFVVHYRMVTYMVAIAVLELPFWLRWRREELLYALKRAAILLGFASLPLVLTELPYYFVMLAVHMFLKARLPFQTYFEQLMGQAMYLVLTYKDAPNTGLRLDNFLTYPYLIWKMEGPAFAIGLIPAALVILWTRRKEDLLLTVLIVVPFLMCTLFNPRARYLSGFIPFLGLMIATAVQRLREEDRFAGLRWARPVAAAAVVLILAFGAVYSYRAAVPKTSYARSIDFIRTHQDGQPKHMASLTVVSQAFCGVKNVPSEWASSEEELRELYDQGYRYFIIDFVKDVIDRVMVMLNLPAKGPKFEKFKQRIDVMNRIEERTTPVFTCENLHLDEIYNVFEVNQHFSQTLQYLREIRNNPKARIIRVYDLKDYFEREGEEKVF
jgi:hypothetical protein